ncbi:gas vesicle protein [Streptomyces tubbatahanensis]|uniref:Gas vesicle protein n=1 Tax=Streptomyces tubbatahanensis TaxID=2923272 RepID=A0ABY3XP91_9ACTN|nr:gas vesicle protein [Streptomyces tubbatahanensis]UNS96189.1 gas vesicle protein [Streptomyces tubbatahanensis]
MSESAGGTAKKTARAAAPRKKSDSARSGTQRNATSETRQKAARKQPAAEAKAPTTAQVLRSARETIEELTGLEAETVSSVVRGEDKGWTLHVEVVELRKIPDSVSMLGSYEMTLDSEGELTGYRRLRRYERGKADPH